nr:hypothetical protein [Acinetobacter sp. Marseille-Q1620]
MDNQAKCEDLELLIETLDLQENITQIARLNRVDNESDEKKKRKYFISEAEKTD